MSIRAVFLDRDGVINRYLPQRYVETPSQLDILPGVAQSIRRLNDAGILVIVISNQQGVARRIMTAEALDVVTDDMRKKLDSEAGAKIDRVYYCMHHRNDDCVCRKPKPGMINWAFRDFGINSRDSVFFGDSESDIRAASAAGIDKRFLLLTGLNRFYEIGAFSIAPSHIFPDFESATENLLR
jgi:histidinol-phosphate phosphatase family protein